MSRLRGVRAASAAGAIALVALVLVGGGRALGVSGPQTVELGTGGTVRGDISLDAGEADVVGLDLAALSRLDLTLDAEFLASLQLLGPDGVALATSTPGYFVQISGFRVLQSGRYQVRVASADGSQGLYSLKAVERWPTKVVKGTFREPTLTFHVPEGGSVTAAVTAKPRKAWNPAITALTAPDGTQLLAAPIAGAKGAVHLPRTVAPAEGMYELDVGGGAVGVRYHAVVTVKGPKVVTTTADLRNGLTPIPPVSFTGNGVDLVFSGNCAYCHAWAASYSGVVARASAASAYIRSGGMPRDSPRLNPRDVALIQSWISTGENP
jgi:hypothetical protein